jgi:fructuronate reductase
VTDDRPRLSRAALRAHRPELAGSLPGPDVGVGIVHLGIGAFHRAHQAVFTQQAMLAEPGDWAIVGVSQRHDTVGAALRPQDGLFTVTERDAAGERMQVVGSVRDVLHAPGEPDRVTAALSDPDTHIVTITVTEAGYRHDPATGRFRPEDPEVAADLAGHPPRTVIGRLVSGLRARRTHDCGLTVLSCDNLPDNGKLVHALVHEFCARLGEAGLAEWIDSHVGFPSTVVDQIVPATTEADLRGAARWLGLRDLGAVVGESYRHWVIEDRFAGPRPAWDKVGVRLVSDIAPHQAAKLRLVNGTHSALAYLGMLAGCRSTAEVAGREEFAGFVRALVSRETGPTVARLGSEVDLGGLLARLTNPRITHLLRQIGTDGPRKLPQRLLEPAADLLASTVEPRLICLAIAGWIRQLRVDDTTPDEETARLRRALAGIDEADRMVDAVLRAWPAVPDALRDSPTFRELVAEGLDQLTRDGVTATLRRAVAEVRS